MLINIPAREITHCLGLYYYYYYYYSAVFLFFFSITHHFTVQRRKTFANQIFLFFFLYKITRLILSFPFPYSPFDRSKIRNIIGHQRTIMCTISRWKEEKIWSPVLIIHIHPSLCIGSRYLATFLSMSGQSTLSQPAFTTDKTRGDYSRSIIRTKRLVVSISVSPDSSFSS